MDYLYIDESGKQAGPVPESAIRALYKGGLIKSTTPIAAANTEDWTPYSAVFGFVNGPLPAPFAAPLPPPYAKQVYRPVRREYEEYSSGAFWWWVLAGTLLVTVTATGVAARHSKLPFSPAGTVFGYSVPWLTGVSGTAGASAPQPAYRDDRKGDSLAEWYDFGFHQGEEARKMFGALGRTVVPDRPQLVQLFSNMELSGASVSQENMNSCFDGYKDGCLAAKPSRTVAANQKRSNLPAKLRGYHKFAEDASEVAGANSTDLEHALGCTVMILAQNEQSGGQGSGFFIGQGVLVTNRHVVQDMQSFTVRLPNKTFVEGKVIAVSDKFDVALMSVPTTENLVMRLAAADGVRVGDHIAAVGFPRSDALIEVAGKRVDDKSVRELEATSTFGQISAVNRKVEGMDCFQMDLTINHGNSGGPTLDSQGRVIGISTFTLGDAKIERTNFAIKISAVMPFIRQHCGFRVDLED